MPIEIEMSFAFLHSLATIEKLSLVKKASMKKLRIFSSANATGQWSFDSNSNIKNRNKWQFKSIVSFCPVLPKGYRNGQSIALLR